MVRLVFTSRLLIAWGCLSMLTLSFAQAPKEDAVLCYKSALKEPFTFYGNPMDSFTLYDNSKWRVSSGGSFEYVPLRYRNVLICPTEQILIIDKRVLFVEKLQAANAKPSPLN